MKMAGAKGERRNERREEGKKVRLICKSVKQVQKDNEGGN